MDRRLRRITLAASVLVGAVLRAWTLTKEGLWIDETITLWFVREFSTPELVTTLPTMQPHLPLYYVLLDGWMDLTGATGVETRWLSVLISLCAIPLVYALGRELFDDAVGLTAAAITALAPFQVYYAQETRMYALLVVTSALAWLTFVYARSDSRGAWWRWAWVVSVGLLVSTHVFGVFVAGAQAAVLAREWVAGRDVRDWVEPATVAGAVAGIPTSIVAWKVIAPYTGVGAAAEVGHVDVTPGVGGSIMMVSKLLVTRIYVATDLPVEVTWFYMTLPLALASGCVVLGLSRADRDRAWELGLWLGIPVVLAVGLSHLVHPIAMARYLAGATPALYLAMARGATSIDVPWVRILTVCLVLSSLTYPLVMQAESRQKPQLDDAAAYVADHADADDVVIVDRDKPQSPMWYYFAPERWDGDASVAVLGDSGGDRAQEADTAWLVSSVATKATRNETVKRLSAGCEQCVDRHRWHLAVVYRVDLSDVQRESGGETDRRRGDALRLSRMPARGALR